MCSYLEYATIGGGKRIRALLVFLVGFLYLPDVNQLMSINSYMLAIEMIHSFSLVHDDLPAIDNDEIRRFKPSVWKKYGEAAAILTGDCLLNQAYSFLLFTLNYVVNMKMHKLEENVFEKKNITKESLFFELDDIRRQILGMYFLADAVGVDGLISGELYDTLFMSKKLSKEKILDIYAKKTGKLFQVSMIIPSCIIYSDERVNMAIGKISEKIGIAYQLLDDLQEHYKSTQEIGKPNDSDIKNDKYTFLRIFGVDETKKELKNIKSFILKQFNIISKRVSIHNERVLLLKYFILYIFDKFGFNEK